MDVKSRLEEELKGARNIVVLGIGNELKGDDSAGLLAAKELKNLSPKVHVFITGLMPENFVSPIKKIKPSHVILIDAASMGEKPGCIRIIDINKIKGATFSTHAQPLNLLCDYLKSHIGCNIIIIGIQPYNLSFGSNISEEVMKAVERLTKTLREIIKDLRD